MKTQNTISSKLWPHSQYTVEYGLLAFVIVRLTRCYASLLPPSLVREYGTRYCQPRTRSKFKFWSEVSTEYVLLLYHHDLGTIDRSFCSCQRHTSTMQKYFQKKSSIDLKFFQGYGQGGLPLRIHYRASSKASFCSSFPGVPLSPEVVPVSFLSLLEMLLMPAIPDLVSYLFPLFLISGSNN